MKRLDDARHWIGHSPTRPQPFAGGTRATGFRHISFMGSDLVGNDTEVETTKTDLSKGPECQPFVSRDEERGITDCISTYSASDAHQGDHKKKEHSTEQV